MKRYFKKKPITVEAWEATADSPQPRWVKDAIKSGQLDIHIYDDGRASLTVHTLEGFRACSDGDYIVKGVKGELYPVDKEIFELSYDEVKVR